MASRRRRIERNWIRNFAGCPLVDPETQTFNSRYAYQLFYGQNEESYPEEYPRNFSDLYFRCRKRQSDEAIDGMLKFLRFIGIRMKKQAVMDHLAKYPGDYEKLLRKCYYILKTLAHSTTELNVANPYRDNSGDIYFLLRIESGESIAGGQLHLFEDLELPDLYSRITSLPEGYEQDPVVSDLFARIEHSSRSFFITGKAGTGKSTFIHFFAQKSRKKVLLLAFTGIAAVNVGGQTIHSFFRFPMRPLLPEDEEIAIFREYTHKHRIISAADTIIVDEVSMLRSDILEAMDYSLRKNGGDPDRRFGGKQILFVGDIFQLPPVVDARDDAGRFLFTERFSSEYFFDAPSYRELDPEYFEFRKSHRQGDDLYFVELLDQVRTCRTSAEALRRINERFDPGRQPGQDEFIIMLTSTNAIAHTENSRRLQELPYTEYSFEAGVSGDFPEERHPAEKILRLKKNAQVVFIKNDLAGSRWVNGTIGKIDFVSKDLIEVRLQDGSVHKLEMHTWENRRYKYDRKRNRIVSEVTGTFTQYPVRLAWAITIHKSQGLTFDHVIIDLGSGAFVNGQVYTALSRCRTLDGITLRRRIRPGDIIADPRIIRFHEAQEKRL